MLHSVLDLPENEGDSRKLNKVEKLVHYFSKQCRHYVAKQNITYKHWSKCEINHEEDREKGNRNKSMQNVVWLYVVHRAMPGKIPSYIQKRHIDEFMCFSCLYQWLVDIQLPSVIWRKEQKVLYILAFFIFTLSSTCPRFKTRRLL